MAKASGTTRASRPSSVGAGMPTQGFLLRDAAAVRKYENTYKQVVQRGGTKSESTRAATNEALQTYISNHIKEPANNLAEAVEEGLSITNGTFNGNYDYEYVGKRFTVGYTIKQEADGTYKASRGRSISLYHTKKYKTLKKAIEFIQEPSRY